MNTKKSLALSMIATLLLTACAEIRLLTYPADFTWIGKEHLTTVMHNMANSVSELNSLVNSDLDFKIKQQYVLQELDLIESYAVTLLGGTEWSATDRVRSYSNHALLDDHMGEFVDDIGIARLQAQAEPANYYGVGKITGSCTSCHRVR